MLISINKNNYTVHIRVRFIVPLSMELLVAEGDLIYIA